jgi:rhodanese-related sulfurtransferase
LNLIDRDELKKKLDRGDEFKLVMALTEWAFQAKHIPGSLNLANAGDVSTLLEKDDEIVVYCSDENCIGSKVAYDRLTRGGYRNVRRYAGGIADWEEHGLPLEGDWA